MNPMFDGDPLVEHIKVLAENFEQMAKVHRSTGEEIGQAAAVAMDFAAWAIWDMLKRGCAPEPFAGLPPSKPTLRAVK